MNTKIILLVFLVLQINCYLNPLLQEILNPKENKSTSSLGLLVLALPRSSEAPSSASTNTDATLQVQGQLKTLTSQTIANPTLTIGSISTAFRGVAVSTSVTGNGSGKFLLKLRKGTITINVFNSSGVSLGSFILTIGNGNSIKLTEVSGANFLVTGLVAYGIDEVVILTEDSIPMYTIGGTVNTPCFVTDCNSGGQFTITNSTNSDSLIVVAGAAPQDGKFTMPTSVLSGTSYNLSVTVNTPNYTCSVAANGSGTVASSNVTNVSVTCTVN
jgi:hypothetical protein